MKLNVNTENIKYIKISYKDNDDFTHMIKAVIKNINERDIYACTKYEEYIYPKTPQEVNISVATDNGLYRAKTTLKSIQKEDKYIYFSLKNPEDFLFEQKREYFRVKLNENALVRYEENENVKQVSGETYDISANGVRLVLDRKIPFPETVQISLFLPQRTITAEARYVRYDEEDNIIKASFSFVNMKELDIDYISQICLKKQLEERRNSIR